MGKVSPKATDEVVTSATQSPSPLISHGSAVPASPKGKAKIA